MKIMRACLFLLALWPAWARAVDEVPNESPYVEGIQCNGNVSTSCELIRTKTGITVGKPLDEMQVDSARLRLQTLPNFRTVRIHLIKGSHKHWVIVVIDVAEADPVTMAFALGSLTQLASQTGQAQIGQVEALAARVTDHDLFGSGKALDLAVVEARPVTGGSGDQSALRLEYSDPRLFDSSRYFLTAGAFYTHASVGFSSPAYQLPGLSSHNDGGGFDFSVGMHLDTYSYATIGYRYLQNDVPDGQYLISDGAVTTLSSSPGSVLLFTVGRNTEDDPLFPTHGWLLHFYDGFSPATHSDFAGIVVRGTWRAGDNAYWTFQARPFDDFRSLFDDDLGVSIVYSHELYGSSQPGAIRAGRWYVGPGGTNLGDTYGIHYNEFGVKAGVRLETKNFGTVNLYVIATSTVKGRL